MINNSTLLILMSRFSTANICIHGHAFAAGIMLVLIICVISIPGMAAQACLFPALEQGRSRLVAASLPSGLVFFAGGLTDIGPSSFVDIYNATSNSWARLPEGLGEASALDQGRFRLAAVSLPSGLVFFAGGIASVFGASSYVDVYNATSNSWTRLPAGLGEARYDLAAASLPSGLVFFAGGRSSEERFSSFVDTYNATSNSWTRLPEGLGQPRSALVAASLPSGLVFFAGGRTLGHVFSSHVDMYNATNNSWTRFPMGLGQAREDLAAASLPSGLVFFAGGWSEEGSTAHVDIYNATSNSWFQFPEGLGQSRYALAATSLLSGLVFFAGGSKVGGLSTYVDMYNATSDSWTRFPEGLGQAREYLSSSSLPSGLVFFAGGASSGSVILLNGFGCVKCSPGTFSNLSGSKATACTACPAGTYNPSSGQTFCTACPAGTYNPTVGSISSSSCIACPAGTYNPSVGSISSSSCIACPAGTYNPSVGSNSSSSCNPCPDASLGQARFALNAVSLPSGLVFFAGGASASNGIASQYVDIYNATSNSWIRVPEGLGQARFKFAGASLPSGLVFFAGGWSAEFSLACTNVLLSDSDSSSYVDMYNETSNSWTRLPAGLGEARYDLAAASLPSGLVFFAGGRSSEFSLACTDVTNVLLSVGGASSYVDMYNETSSSWTRLPAGLGQARYTLAAASLPSGLVFFAGGRSSELFDGLSSFVDIYNSTSNSWTSHPEGLGQARSLLAAASLPTGLVFFAGGSAGSIASSYVDMFNMTSNGWTRFPEGLGQTRFELAAASLPSGLVFFAGGSESNSQTASFGGLSSYVDVYNASSNIWTRFPGGLGQGRTRLAAASLPSGLVFFAGGIPTGKKISNHVDLYNERFFSDPQTSLCPHCIAGSVILLNGFGCVKCSPGTFSNLSGSKATACTACPAGTYNPSSGQTFCTACPVGTYNPTVGSISSSSCIACPAGTYNPSSRQIACTACPAGTYNPSSGHTFCTACPAGTYNPSVGSISSTSCIACPAGTYNPSSRQIACTACPAGTYNPTNGGLSSFSCIACPVGKFSPLNGSVSFSSCSFCPAGTYNPFNGQKSCAGCPAGTYNPALGQTACTSCPKAVEGFNCSLPNQANPVIQAGFYIDYSRLSGCKDFKCDAIVKCPNPSACPGTTEKECLQTEEECYNNQSPGCISCCDNFFIEDLVCKPCPEDSQVSFLLGLRIFALILFTMLSSCFDFPPFVLAAQYLKIFLSNMQGFVSLRLLSVLWPSVIIQLFDFTRIFNFNFDLIRPECTLEYSPQTKLLFTLIGPAACFCFISFIVFIHILVKCCHISKIVQKINIKSVQNKRFNQLVLSIAHCMLTTSFVMKFHVSRIMVDGALWNALSPSLTKRSNISVLLQKFRRSAVTQHNLAEEPSSISAAFSIPEDWLMMQSVLTGSKAEVEFSKSVERIRLFLGSAFSIFIFTFQGSIESALSTFDCKHVDRIWVLRSNPKIHCNFDDGMYPSMVVTTIIGLTLYCLLLPSVAIITLRSRWCQEVYVLDSIAYSKIFGFLTSMYSKRCALWELVACVRKVAFVAFPVFIFEDAFGQSVLMFSSLLVYTFFTLKMQPMASAVLNQLEMLSCISLTLGCFSSIFFIEYNGQSILSRASRELLGMLLVIMCAVCVVMSLALLWRDYSRLMLMHKDKFVSKWTACIMTQMQRGCKEGFVLSVISLFCNDASSSAILEAKRKLRLELAAIDQQFAIVRSLPWYSVGKRISGYAKNWRDRLSVRVGLWRYEPSEEALNRCLGSSEFECMKFLDGLTERMAAWSSFPDKHLPSDQLPKAFVDAQGAFSPPHDECKHLCRIQQIADAFISADMQRTMFAMMLSEKMDQIRPIMRPSHREFNTRAYGLLHELAARFSDIDAICRTIGAECLDVQAHSQWWNRLWHKFWCRSASESSRILNFICNLDENQTIELASKALGKTSCAHMTFKECHQKKDDSPTVIHRNRIKARRQMNHTASAVAQLNKTFQPFNVLGTHSSEQHVISVSTANIAARDIIDVHTSRLTLPEMPVAQVRDRHVLQKKEAGPSLKSRPLHPATSMELEEVVVQPAGCAVDLLNSTSDRYRVDARAVLNGASLALAQMNNAIRVMDEHVLNASHCSGFGNPKLSADEHLKIVKMQHAKQFKDG